MYTDMYINQYICIFVYISLYMCVSSGIHHIRYMYVYNVCKYMYVHIVILCILVYSI